MSVPVVCPFRRYADLTSLAGFLSESKREIGEESEGAVKLTIVWPAEEARSHTLSERSEEIELARVRLT